jgi:hypothetical protein
MRESRVPEVSRTERHIQKRKDSGVGNLAIDDRSNSDRMSSFMSEPTTSGPFGPLLREWARCKGDRELPRRSDFDPARVAEWLSHLGIVEKDHRSQKFRYRLTGTRMDLYLGRNLTGQYVAEVEFQKAGTTFWTLLESCASESNPTFGDVGYIGARGHLQACQVMMLPWRTDGAGSGQIFVVQDFSPLASDQDLMKS